MDESEERVDRRTVVLVGLNHKTAPVELREQLSLADCGLRMTLEDMGIGGRYAEYGNGDGGSIYAVADHLLEGAILSTCNRLEVYGVCLGDPQLTWDAIEQYLCDSQGVSSDELRPHLYYMRGREAVEQLMRVSTSLDSMVLGEPQILGQVLEAGREARAAGASGPVLTHLYARAVHAGKRARTETEIGQHTTSVSHAAALVAAKEVDDLSNANILVVGAGDMAVSASRALQGLGVQKVSFINRTFGRAKELALQHNGEALSWFQLPEALTAADIVITATGAPHVVIHPGDVLPVLEERKGRKLLFIDIAVPRDVDETVGEIPTVMLLDIDELQTTVDANMAQRQAAVPYVEDVISEETDKFLEWLRSREVVPVLVVLREWATEIANEEFERALGKLGNTAPVTRRVMSRMAERIVKKILHAPTVRLKASASSGNAHIYSQALRELFDLDRQHAAKPNQEYEIVINGNGHKPVKEPTEIDAQV